MRKFPGSGQEGTEGLNPAISILDGILSRFHRRIVLAHPVLSLAVATALYALALVFGARAFGVSSNFFIILPVVIAALGFELAGGLIAGGLGLPANLALFALIGHPEYAPESLLIAEFSGLVLGGALGFLSDYFSKLEAEVVRRRTTEDSLRRALEDKEVLLRELHHRVRNNLNIIKSIIQLQRNRSKDPVFLEATEDLLGRVFAIALVHDRLSGMLNVGGVDPRGYLSTLAAQVIQALGPTEDGPAIILDIPEECAELDPDRASVLGLIVNEAITNAAKHAFRDQGEAVREPSVFLSYREEGEDIRVRVEDNGQGLPEGHPEGLGFRLIRILAHQLSGESAVGSRTRPRAILGDDPTAGIPEAGLPGTCLELVIPRQDPKQSE